MSLDALEFWPVDRVAAASVDPAGEVTTFGDLDEVFELASVTKLMTALAVLVAHEEGTIDLDEPATAADATMADLLAHSAGLGPDDTSQIATPRTRRIYSTAAYDVAADLVAERAAMPFADYLAEAVFAPLRMSATSLHGSAGAGARSCVRDLLQLTEAWREPVLVNEATLRRATTPHLPDLGGVLPGFGRQTPNPWGLGPEIRGHKSPHWTSDDNSSDTFGHFGQTGTMVWIDPSARRTAIALTDRDFGDWAIDAWPRLASGLLTT